MLFEGTTVELEVIPSSTVLWLDSIQYQQDFLENSPLIENRLRVPRTGIGVKAEPPILRLDSTSSSSNFLRLIERVELVRNLGISYMVLSFSRLSLSNLRL